MDNKIIGLIIVIIVLVGAIGFTSAMLLQKNNVTSNISANNTTNNGTTNNTAANLSNTNINSSNKNSAQNQTVTQNTDSASSTITPKISASQAEGIVRSNGYPGDAVLSVSYDGATGIYTVSAQSTEYNNGNSPASCGYAQVNGQTGVEISQDWTEYSE